MYGAASWRNSQVTQTPQHEPPTDRPALQVHDLRHGRAALAAGTARATHEAAGLSQGEVAAAVGVSPAAVALWEAGKRRPHGEAGAAYGRLLRELEEATTAAGATA